MDRARTTGAIIMAGAVVQLLFFLYGMARKSYLALALPMTAAMTTLTALAFWVGWTMISMEDEPEEPPIAPAE